MTATHRNTVRAVLFSAFLLTAGCASLNSAADSGQLGFLAGMPQQPRAPASQDAVAKQFMPTAGKASVYVFRTGEYDRLLIRVFLDGQPLGLLEWRTYLFAEMEPGKHTLMAGGEVRKNDDTLTIDTEADHSYFVAMDVATRWFMARPIMNLVKEDYGRSRVRDCSLVLLHE